MLVERVEPNLDDIKKRIKVNEEDGQMKLEDFDTNAKIVSSGGTGSAKDTGRNLLNGDNEYRATQDNLSE